MPIREHIEPASTNNYVFYCDCNNNAIERITGIDLSNLWNSVSSLFQIDYTLDPLDSSRYCVKKYTNKHSPITIGDFSISGTTSDRYLIAKTTSYSDESTVKWLASPTYGSHVVEFQLYVSNTGAAGSIFDSTGLGNDNSNAQNSGIALMRLSNGNIIIRARNNSSTNMDTIVGHYSVISGKWLNCIFSFEYLSTTSYKATAVISEVNTGTILASTTHTMTIPLNSNRYFTLFFNDGWNPAWAADMVDYIKEVKVYKME